MPVWFGSAAGPKTFAHLAEYADGWMPNGGSGLRQHLPRLREAWDEAGRAGSPEVVVVGVVPDDGKLEYDDSPDDSMRDYVEEAADVCPVQAIEIHD